MKRQWILEKSVIGILMVILVSVGGRGAWADVLTAPVSGLIRAPGDTLIVDSTADSGPGTLRQTLLDATSGDTIIFDTGVFPPGSPQTIALASALPHIVQGYLTIDASIAGVILDGSALSEGDGLHITSDGNEIKGLQILYFPDAGVYIGDGAQSSTIGGDSDEERNVISGNSFNQVTIAGAGTDYNVISGNYIGTASSGLQALGGGYGVRVEFGAQHNIIGGTTSGERNLISGNGKEGVVINNSGTMHNLVVGNFIGTDVSGTAPISNGNSGIGISYGASYNRVGGDAPGERNLISGNGIFGVGISGLGTTNNTISGNYIGTDISGTTSIGNDESGISIFGGASHNLIGGINTVPGGACTGDCNLISGNSGDGVYIEGASTMSNTISGNYIGADASGMLALPNGNSGVLIRDGASYNSVGGGNATPTSGCSGECNLVSSNGGSGVGIDGSGTMSNTVSGNFIGLDLDGTVDIHTQALAISPDYATDTTIFVGTEKHGISKSTDGGGSWSEANTGLTISKVGALGISPAYPTDRTIFAGTFGGGAFKSTDGGDIWAAVNTGLDEVNVWDFAISPDYEADQTILAATNSGIFRSSNGGGNWAAANNGLTNLNMSALAISPNYATDQTVFASTGGGVFKSTDMGSSWTEANDGLTDLRIVALATSPNYAADQTIFAGTEGHGVFKSTDGGGSWASVGLINAGPIGVLAFSPDYATNQTIFVGTRWEGYGVCKSTDGGSNWTQINNGIANADDIRALAISSSYATDQTVFVAAFWDGIFKSVDGGSNWIPANNGLTELGNYGQGVAISGGAQWNTIGGDTLGEKNIISNNSSHGISISGVGTNHNNIIGNYIGTDATGSTNLGNAIGVIIADGAQQNVIGGTGAGERNVISGNNWEGIGIAGSGTNNNVVISNFIGTDATGSAALGNGGDGVGIREWGGGGAQENRIGGTMEEERNIIAFNGGHGVGVYSPDSLHNTITRNSIHDNNWMGIGLEDGGNAELAAPAITYFDLAAGVARGTACAGCTVEVFSDSSDEGEVYEGSTTAGGAGDWVFDKGARFAGPHLTATATDADGNTSEFSAPAVPPSISHVVPKQGTNDVPNEVNVYGLNFAEGASVTLGTIPPTDLATWRLSSTHLRATVPAGLPEGTYDLTVTNPNGDSDTLANAYTVFDAHVENDDLYAQSHDLWCAPPAVRQGEQVDLGLIVHRQGGKITLSNIVVRFYDGDPDGGGTSIGDGIIYLLSPRSSASTTRVPWSPAVAGDHAIYARIDPDDVISETIETNNTISTTVTVLPSAGDTTPPVVTSFTINDGAETTAVPTVTLAVSAEDNVGGSGMGSMFFVELEFAQAAMQWVPVQASGWLSYTTRYTWTLVPVAGIRYMQAWAADRAGNISLYPYKDRINYLLPSDRVAMGQVRLYRNTVAAGQTLTVIVSPVSGDPDLYVWPPTEGAPARVSNDSTGVDQVSIVATASGTYQIEVYGYTAAEYTISINVSGGAARPAAGQQDVQSANADKPSRPEPLIPATNEPLGQMAVPSAPVTGDVQKIYLPLVLRGSL